MAKDISTSYRLSSAAAQSFDNVTVVDPDHLSSGLGLLTLYAAHLAENGLPAAEILKELEEMKARISTSFIVPSMASLWKNKKIGDGIYRICQFFNLHPVLTMKKGTMKLGGLHGGNMERSYAEYIRRTLRKKKNIDTKILFITYSGCSAQQLKQFREEVEKYQKFERIILQKTSATISSNCGLGAMGLSFIKTKRAHSVDWFSQSD